MWVGVVVLKREVAVVKLEDVFHVGVDTHCGQRSRVACELQTALLDVVVVYVGVAEGMDEVAVSESCDLRYHHGEQCVGGDIVGYAEEYVGASLVKLARESSVGDVELEKAVAWR